LLLFSDSEIHYRPYYTHSSFSQSASQSTSQFAFQSASQSASQSTSTIDSQTSSQSIQENKHKKKRFQLLLKDINLAKKHLLALPQLEEHGEYMGTREITLKENVSLQEYLDYRDKNPSLSVHMYLHEGKIKVYEVPSTPHAMVSAVIKILMGRWNYDDLEYGDNTNMIVG
jgi:hypothetical protein